MMQTLVELTSEFIKKNVHLKSLGPIERNFHGKNDGFVLYEYMII